MILYFLSDRRDSNPQHSPWKGDTLPIELLSHLEHCRDFIWNLADK